MKTDPTIGGGARIEKVGIDWSLLAVLVAVSTVGPLAMNIITPSLPTLADYFAVPYGAAQLALTLYLFATAFSHLFLGPLSDRFGRRPVVVCGMVLYIAASLASTVALSIEWLVTARMFQAAGAAAGIALGRAMIRDRYPQDQAAGLTGFVTMTFILVPMVTPTLGGWLADQYGWRSIFVFCAAFGAIIFLIALLKLPETRPDVAGHNGFLSIFRDVGPLLTDREFVLYTLALSFGAAMFFAYMGGAPYVMIELMGQTKTQFGYWFIFGAIGYMVGNLASGMLSARIGAERMTAAGIFMGLIGASAILAHTLTNTLTPLSLSGSMTLVAFSNGLALPNAFAKIIGLSPRIAGSASGISGFIQMLIGAISAQIVGLLITDTALPLALAMFLSGCLSVTCIVLVNRGAEPK